LTLTASGGANYSWTGPGSFVSNSQNPSISNASVAASGNYSVTQTVSTCVSPVGQVSITVNQTPVTPTVSGTSTLCAGSNFTLNANPAGGNYNWSGPNSFVSSVQNPVINGAGTTATGNYSLYLNLLSCKSSTVTYSVTVNAMPSAPTTGSNYSLCSGSTLTLTAGSGANYSWTGPNS